MVSYWPLFSAHHQLYLTDHYSVITISGILLITIQCSPPVVWTQDVRVLTYFALADSHQWEEVTDNNIQIWISVYIPTLLTSSTRTHMHTHTHAHAHTCTCTCVCAHTHTHTHTHSITQSLSQGSTISWVLGRKVWTTSFSWWLYQWGRGLGRRECGGEKIGVSPGDTPPSKEVSI